MKRTPLRRKTPLRAKKALARGKAPLKRTPLKTGTRRPVSAAERLAQAAWGKCPPSARCVVCGHTKAQAFLAGTRLQGHHAIPKQTLKKICDSRGLERATVVWDLRNRLWVCEEPCHSQHTTAYKRIPRSRLPRRVFEFAAEHALQYVLERQYPL